MTPAILNLKKMYKTHRHSGIFCSDSARRSAEENISAAAAGIPLFKVADGQFYGRNARP